ERYRNIGIRLIEAKIAARVRGAWLPLPDGRKILADEQHLPPLPKIEPPVPSERPPSLPAPPLPRRQTETVSQAFEAYLRTELGGTGAGTIPGQRRKVKIFTDKVGDLPLSKITEHMVVEFLDDYLLRERGVSASTRNGYAMLLSAVFKCAIRRKRATANPFAGQRVKAVTTHYEPFADEELATLFADLKPEIIPTKHKTGTALPWASLIGAYTGA